METEDVTEEPESYVTPQLGDIEQVELGQGVMFQASGHTIKLSGWESECCTVECDYDF